MSGAPRGSPTGRPTALPERFLRLKGAKGGSFCFSVNTAPNRSPDFSTRLRTSADSKLNGVLLSAVCTTSRHVTGVEIKRQGGRPADRRHPVQECVEFQIGKIRRPHEQEGEPPPAGGSPAPHSGSCERFRRKDQRALGVSGSGVGHRTLARNERLKPGPYRIRVGPYRKPEVFRHSARRPVLSSPPCFAWLVPPPVPVLRRCGVRTRREIDEEKYALKALRGDFGPAHHAEDAKDRAEKAWQAAAGAN